MTVPRAFEVGDAVTFTMTGEVLSAHEVLRVDVLRVAVGPFEHSKSEVLAVRAADVTLVEPVEPVEPPASGPQELERRVRKMLAYFERGLDPAAMCMRERFQREKDPEYWREHDVTNRYVHRLLATLIRDSFPDEAR